MPRKDSASQATHRKKETTLKEAVVVRIKQFFDLYGLDAAMRKFDEMKVDFAGNQDWPVIDKEVMDFLGEKRRLALLAEGERQQQLDQAWMQGLSSGASGGQVVFQTGSNAQAPYCSAAPINGGHKQ